jgi:inner membrane transporter RhtA
MPPNGKPSTIQSSGQLRGLAEAVPPTGLVLLSIFSVQVGAAIAKGLFDQLGPAGTVFLRVGFAALVLLLLWRPPLGGHARGGYLVAVLFGLALAAMNFSLYQALDRIPLGVAVALEFVGPLGVAVAGSRRMLDLLWVVLAAAGIVLLAPLDVLGGTKLDPIGVALALLAGSFWAAYILLSARTGSIFPGGTGLVVALCVGTVVLVPVGIAGGGAALLDPKLLLVGFAVAMLSSAIPYSLELEALRKLSARVFGVLMSLEPAVAASIGFVALGERLEMRALAAVLLVTVAAVGASRFGGLEPRD